LDSRWVVPYNPGLLMRYNYHINVGAFSSIKAIKYLFKYVYKVHDCASFSVNPSHKEDRVINEIRQYRDARYMSPLDDIPLPFKFKRKQFPIRLSFAMIRAKPSQILGSTFQSLCSLMDSSRLLCRGVCQGKQQEFWPNQRRN
jgi:hypothetical protein